MNVFSSQLVVTYFSYDLPLKILKSSCYATIYQIINFNTSSVSKQFCFTYFFYRNQEKRIIFLLCSKVENKCLIFSKFVSPSYLTRLQSKRKYKK